MRSIVSKILALLLLSTSLLAQDKINLQTQVKNLLAPSHTASFVDKQTGTSYTIPSADNGALLLFTSSNPVAVTLPQASGAFGCPFTNSCFYFDVTNTGTGNVVITPQISTIGGASSLTLSQNQSARIFSDGANYQVEESSSSLTLAGDLGGTISSPKVIGIQGTPVNSTPPTSSSPYLWYNPISHQWQATDPVTANLVVTNPIGTQTIGGAVSINGALTSNTLTVTPNFSTPAAVFNCLAGLSTDCFDVEINGVKQFFIDLNGKTNLQASDTNSASFNMQPGTAPANCNGTGVVGCVGDWYFLSPSTIEYVDNNQTLQDVAASNIPNVFTKLNTFIAPAANSPAQVVRSLSGQSGDVWQVQDSTSTVQVRVASDFSIIAPAVKTVGTANGSEEFVATNVDPRTLFSVDPNSVRLEAPNSIANKFRVILPSAASTAATTQVFLFDRCPNDADSVPTCTGSIGQVPVAALANATTTINGTGFTLGASGNLGQLNDTNGNATIKSVATTSAVDFINVTNSATGNPATVTLTAAGTDANISINLVSKGTGTIQCNGANCGGGGGGPTLQVNGVNTSNQGLLNLTNSGATNGLTLTFTNTSGGIAQLGLSGTLNNSGLTNSSTTVNGDTCTLGSTCTVTGGVNVQTSGYTLTASDNGKLVIMNCSLSCTVTMNGSPTSGYYGRIMSIGSTTAIISLNGKQFNGATSVPVLSSFRPLTFYSDGTNYYGDAPLVAGSGITFTPASNGMTIAASGGGGGTTIDVNGSALTASTGNFETSSTIIGSPSTQVAAATNNGDSLGIQFAKDTGTPTNIIGYAPNAMMSPNSRHVVWIQSTGGAFSVMGDVNANTGTVTHIAASSSDPVSDNFATTSTSGSNAGIIGNLVLRTGRNIRTRIYGELIDQASLSQRVWIGLTASSLTNMLASDTPAFNFAAFRYSNVAADTNFQCIVGNGTATTIKDTGVAADASGHVFELVFDDTASKIQCLIDGVVKATFVSSDNVPSGNMAHFAGIQTQTGAIRDLREAYLFSTSDK